MNKKILSFLLLTSLILSQLLPFYQLYAVTETDPDYTVLRNIDVGTFNEYRYKITEKFFLLRDKYELSNSLDKKILEDIGVIADTGYKYLPDNLKNKNYLKQLLTDLKKGVQEPDNETQYTQILKSIANYLDKVDIQTIQGSIEALPAQGNAPLNTTFRAQVTDPSGTKIQTYNYTWWVDIAGKRSVIGRGVNLNYTFREEGNYTVFLDVVSTHRNTEANIDVLPFRARAEVKVKEKIASLIIKVNSETLANQDELKFIPGDANYGLIFDATSSTPTGGAKFSSTEWNFGNGIKKKYNGDPKIERVRYTKEGDYEVSLKLTTNEGKSVERIFNISIHQPIATINVDKEEGYIGDKFTFSAKPSGSEKNLSYSWEIIDIEKDNIISKKTGKILTHTFISKGKFNIRLTVNQASGESDVDTKIIYINSQSPIAEFQTSMPQTNKPNMLLLDGSKSFDPDFSDDGNLVYSWYIDGNKVSLENSNTSGSTGYYIFDSIGNHDVSLEVRDPDGIVSIKKAKVEISSLLSLDFYAFPRVVQRESFVKFVAESPEAQIYNWDFGDGVTEAIGNSKASHKYLKSGAFDVTLKVVDKDDKTNTYKKTVYVGESESPVAVFDVIFENNEQPVFDPKACGGKGAYIVNRANSLVLDSKESINIDGQVSGLEYTWKIGNDKFSTSPNLFHKFDELGCFPLKLTAKSIKNGKTDVMEKLVDVRNIPPTLSALQVTVTNPDADPLIVNVSALGAKDIDGVIQSYLWYYYTDVDAEPQDFRSSMTPQTTFVLPKITGNYYFVAVMKDNNEARVTSEELTGSKFFTTITGDNINTPLVDLKSSDTNVGIGEEITFTAVAKDILGQDLTSKSKYSWDFDGDGFYDMETTEATTKYKFTKSGTFYSKVKVKYKGLSSTRNITLSVSNKLVSDFEYISIGNKFIFFDTSLGQIDTYNWDLGDGTKVQSKSFVYTYNDEKTSHEVTLRITEGTKTKEIKKTVVKNIKNILGSRKEGINIFSSPLISPEGKIQLDSEEQKVFLYLGESKGEIAGYVLDYDTEIDTDLNGSKDDDADNKATGSYSAGDVTEIPLSAIKVQKIRVFLLDTAGSILDSQDIQIEKTYIKEMSLDMSTIVFEGVSEEEKQIIDSLKTYISELPQAQKLESMEYMERLQENWNDTTEKTRTIIDFESYLIDNNVEKSDEMFELLESLLVIGQADTSEKAVSLQALKNLIPESIICEFSKEFPNCRSALISKLEKIYESTDTVLNTTLGEEVLSVVALTDSMNTQQKLDFKAILKSLIYGGIDSIPVGEKQAVIGETPSTTGESRLISTLVSISYWIGIALLIFMSIIVGYYLYYKISNRDSNVGFQDFIIDKTSFKKSELAQKGVQKEVQDVLADDLTLNTIPTAIDPLSQTNVSSFQDGAVGKDTLTSVQDKIPDWLMGNISPQQDPSPIIETIAIPDTQIEEIQNNDLEIPVSSVDSLGENMLGESILGETQLEEESIPDWLKQDFATIPAAKILPEQDGVDGKIILEDNTLIVPTGEDIAKNTIEKAEDASIPDWLKESFEVSKEVPVSLGVPKQDLEIEIKTPAKSKKKAISKKTSEGATKVPSEKKQGDTKKGDELWDDGMKIPDWLKTDDEK